ncbi:hypothetical protein WN943_021136 [Citrus x changshan-huyou]
MTAKEFEEKVEQLSHLFNEKVDVSSQQSNDVLSLAIEHLDGDAVPWYHWLEQTMGNMNWAQFKRDLVTRFGTFEEVNIQGFQFHLDFFLLPISGRDIVLGVDWLRSLGAILWHFSKLTMQFTWKGQNVQLNGYDYLPPALILPNSDLSNLCGSESNLDIFAIPKRLHDSWTL